MGKCTQLRKEAIASSESKASRSRVFLIFVTSIVATAVTTLLLSVGKDKETGSGEQSPAAGQAQQTTALQLVDSLLVQPDLADNTDIALLNLVVTPGLPPSDRAHIIGESLNTLDEWAKAIAAETYRNRDNYQKNPKEFGNEAGCLGDSRIGTCASLPVLYVALGRRMGYPMHLVAAKGHLFARWDDGKGTRVNLEASNAGGYSSYPDSHYRTWPHPLSRLEEERGGYLINLTAQQCLAIFLTSRTACLESKGQRADAIATASAAFRLAPNLGGVVEMLRLSVGTNPTPNHSPLADNNEIRKLNVMVHAQQMARQRYEADAQFRASGGATPNLPSAYQPPIPGFPHMNSFGQPVHNPVSPLTPNPYSPR